MDILMGADGRIAYPIGGDFAVTSVGAEDLAQRLRIRLNTYKGEWFMDKTVGLDWFNDILGKGRSRTAIDAIVQAEIAKERDVLQITKFESSVVNGEYTCTFTVRTTAGAITNPITI